MCAPQSPSVAHLSRFVSPLSVFITCGNPHARWRTSQSPRHNKLHCSSFMFRLAVLCRNHDQGDDILDWVMLFWQTNPCQTMWPSSQHAANIHSEQPGSLLSCWCGKRGRRSLFWEERKSCCETLITWKIRVQWFGVIRSHQRESKHGLLQGYYRRHFWHYWYGNMHAEKAKWCALPF